MQTNFDFKFWLRLALTVLTAFAAAFGVSACGMDDVSAMAAGFIGGTAVNA